VKAEKYMEILRPVSNKAVLIKQKGEKNE